jgi:hypothetical protein
MSIMTEAVSTSRDRLRILAFDRKVEVVGHTLNHS